MTDVVSLRLAVMDLYADYSACLDDGHFETWPDFFTEDGYYELIPRENYEKGHRLATMALEGRPMLRDRVFGIQKTLFYAPYYQRHIIGPIKLSNISTDFVDTRANYAVIRTKRNALSEVFNAGVYLDRIARTGAGLKFAIKRCVFDSEMVPNSVIYPI